MRNLGTIDIESTPWWHAIKDSFYFIDVKVAVYHYANRAPQAYIRTRFGYNTTEYDATGSLWQYGREYSPWFQIMEGNANSCLLMTPVFKQQRISGTPYELLKEVLSNIHLGG